MFSSIFFWFKSKLGSEMWELLAFLEMMTRLYCYPVDAAENWF